MIICLSGEVIMKQTILSILGCMVIAFGMTGCGSSRNQFDIVSMVILMK